MADRSDPPVISVFRLQSGAWLVEPKGKPTRREEVRAFPELADAAVYAAGLGLSYFANVIIMVPHPELMQ